MDTSLLDKAIHFAVEAHLGTERRGKGYPYIIHPLEAVTIVATMTADQRLLAAAALHDVVEDTDISIEQLRSSFGDEIAQLVAEESHPKDLGWRESRELAITHLRQASRESQIVAMGDKLSNMRAIAHDYRDLGSQLWARFNAPNGAADYAWYYRSLLSAFTPLSDTQAYREFAHLVEEVFPNETV